MNTFKVRNKQLNWLSKVSFEIILTEIEDMFKHLWYERFVTYSLLGSQTTLLHDLPAVERLTTIVWCTLNSDCFGQCIFRGYRKKAVKCNELMVSFNDQQSKKKDSAAGWWQHIDVK